MNSELVILAVGPPEMSSANIQELFFPQWDVVLLGYKVCSSVML